MASRRVFNTRSHELRPNREGRPATREAAKRGSFGLFLPLTTVAGVKEPLDEALTNVGNYWRAERGDAPMAHLRSHADIGVTLVKHSVVQQSMGDMLRQGFQLKDLRERLEQTPEAIGAKTLEVPITEAKWLGDGKRKLALMIDMKSEAAKHLEEQAEALECVFSSITGGGRIVDVVDVPDHISIAKYGENNDGMGIKRSLRRGSAGMVHDYLRYELDQNPLVMRLGSLVVGRDYRSLSGMELEATLPPQVFTSDLLDAEPVDIV